jgi:hypothetical protein
LSRKYPTISTITITTAAATTTVVGVDEADEVPLVVVGTDVGDELDGTDVVAGAVEGTVEFTPCREFMQLGFAVCPTGVIAKLYAHEPPYSYGVEKVTLWYPDLVAVTFQLP